jgi:uncharacterized protein YbjT (DUF2867 family)
MPVDPLVSVRQVDYADAEGLRAAAAGCTHAVHLVGIIKQSTSSTYEGAHVAATEALIEALAGSDVTGLIYLSLLGSSCESRNQCLATRGRAEALFAMADIPVLTVRVPMVLGEHDFASRSLARKARASLALTIHAESKEQPIYAGDVVSAILNAFGRVEDRMIELAGPQSLSRRDLVARAGMTLGTRGRVISLPLWAGRCGTWLMEKTLSNPPLTMDMLGVLNHDDDIDPAAAADLLDIDLTSLEAMLERVLVAS